MLFNFKNNYPPFNIPILQRSVSRVIICPNYLAHSKASFVIFLNSYNGLIFKVEDILRIYHRLSNLSYLFLIF